MSNVQIINLKETEVKIAIVKYASFLSSKLNAFNISITG